MKTSFLFPHKYKKLGWLLFVPSLIIGIMLLFTSYDIDSNFRMKVFAIANGGLFEKTEYFHFIENGVLDEIITILILIGGLLIVFSKTKDEDEFISKIRYESLVWATYLNFGLLFLGTILIYDIFYFDVLLFNVFAMLLFFIIRFHYMLYKLQKTMQDEE